MTPNELIQYNRSLQKKLNAENESYYSDLLLYLRGKSLFKSDQILEEKALEILQDILDAQDVGQSAKDYFGENPKTVADDLLMSIPISVGDFIKMAVYGIAAYIIVNSVVWVFSSNKMIDFGQFLIVALYALIGAFGILWFVGNEAYEKNMNQKKILKGFLFALYIIIGLVLTTFVDTAFKYVINSHFIVGMIAVSVILIAGLWFVDRRKKE